MTATLIARDPRKDMEIRAEVEGLGALHDQRRQLAIEYLPLKALYGHDGCWDARRKQMVEAAKIHARDVCEKAGTKVTEGLVDAMAHGSDSYVAFITNSIEQRTRFLELDLAWREIEERIKSREIEIMYAAAEARLGR